MSAFFSFQYADCIQLMTDGAVYDTQGVLHHVMNKSFTARCLPLALTGRGNCFWVEEIGKAAAEFTDKCGSVDQALEWLEDAASRIGQRADELEARGGHFEILAAGYS